MTRRPRKQAKADVPAAALCWQWEREEEEGEEENNVRRRAGKELVEGDVPAARPLQREDQVPNKRNTR
jgi:hypothetical protein